MSNIFSISSFSSFPIATSSSKQLVSSELLQSIPLQSPQADTHEMPFFWHEHNLEPHGFLDVSLQLQRITFSNSFGAMS